jgi:DNA-directed RNA polymerase
MKTQLDIEQENYDNGMNKALKEFHNDKSKGRLSETKGASQLIQHYKNALADELILATEKAHNGKAVPRRIANKLIIILGAEQIAHFTVQAVLNTSSMTIAFNKIVNKLAETLKQEFVLSQAKDEDKKKFKYLTAMMAKRVYTGTRKLQIANQLVKKYQNVDHHKSLNDFKTLALYALEYLSEVRIKTNGGVFDTLYNISTYRESSKQSLRMLKYKPWFSEYIEQNILNGNLVSSSDTPLIEKPIAWINFRGGGFHSENLKYNFISRGKKKDYTGVNMSKTMDAVNRLQETPLRVNKRILEVMEKVVKDNLGIGDLPKHIEVQHTPYPFDGIKYTEATPEQQAQIIQWKITKTTGHELEISNGSKYMKLLRCISEAKRFRDYNEIYFAYYVDYRGRMYPKAAGLSPQGDNFTKSLLELGKGKTIDNLDSEMFFASHGANTFGEDKISRIEKHKLILSMEEQIGLCVDDPMNPEAIWHEADDPWGFLAFCFEWYDYRIYGDAFKSHLSVAMDGSCNGLQHLSAMCLDEVGGKSVNLTNNSSKEDIYTDVMNVTIKLLEDNGSVHALKLLELNAVTRKSCKKPVMTVPYAGTQMGTRDTVRAYLNDTGIISQFDTKEHPDVVTLYTQCLWDAISMVVIKAREVMNFLKKMPKLILEASDKNIIEWTTPNGFKVVQRKPNLKIYRVNTLLGEFCGNRRSWLQLRMPLDTPNKGKHGNSIAPNLIHSLDACHLQNTINSIEDGVSLNMIHDSYGTHASDCRQLYEAIRQQFYDIYKNNDVLQNWIAQQPEFDHEELPINGNLDLSEVLNSEYFFA